MTSEQSGPEGAQDKEELGRQMTRLQELTRELDAIINSSSDGLWICDAHAKVLRVNPAAERVNNALARDLVGQTMPELVNQGFIDKSVTLEVIKNKTVISLLLNREGRKLMATGTPVFNEAGELIRVVTSVKDITEIDRLQRELEEQESIKDQFRHHMLEKQQLELASHQVVARSPDMLKVLRQAVKVAAVDSSVLILGESGVGKGMIADLIHKNSRRADGPLIKINCGAIPESLIESELFGYERGAFTGALTSGKAGYFEVADGGTLFLDEIAELPLSSQVKLLRFLEEGQVSRLGGTKTHSVSVRILAATHRNLEEMVRKGRFRLDLFYRLNVIPLQVPALRERRDCILYLLRHYIDQFAARHGVRRRLSRPASDALLAYPYPGNVRELMNICERLVVMSETELIDLQDLPGDIACRSKEGLRGKGEWVEGMSLEQILDDTERAVLSQAMEKYGNQSRAAAALSVSQSTIARRLSKYGIG